MKPTLLFLAAALLAFTSCNRNTAQSDEQRQADEKRLAELRDLESRAAQRDADARSAQLEADRQRLADDQAALDEEKRKLAAEKSALRDDAAEARYRAEEQRLAQRDAALRKERERAAEAEREAPAADEARQAKRDAAERKIDFFYDALDPLGDWMEVDPYGYVWQPRQARSGDWRPYTDGTWVYTDYGWTWNANEPFGWATYHYGRWARLRERGWVWVPGSEWAPAWVSWRKSPEYVGWAPLPPEAHSGSGFNSGVDSYYDIGPSSYTFVPARRIGEPTYRGVVVEPAQNVTIVNQTVNVTRINYTTVENKTVVFNRGPDLDQVNATSARPIQRLRLERESDRAGGGSTGNNVTAGVLRLLAPSIASAPRAAAAPAKLKEHVRSAEVERGWGTGGKGDEQTARTKFRQEAAQAEQQAQREPAHTVPAKIIKPLAPAATPSPVREADPVHRPDRPKLSEPAPDGPVRRAETPAELKRPAAPATPAPMQATPRPKPAPAIKPFADPSATPARPTELPKMERPRLPASELATPKPLSIDRPVNPLREANPPKLEPSAPLATPAGKPRKATPPDGVPATPPVNPRKGPPMPDSQSEPRKALSPDKAPAAPATPRTLGGTGTRPSGFTPAKPLPSDATPATPAATPKR